MPILEMLLIPIILMEYIFKLKKDFIYKGAVKNGILIMTMGIIRTLNAFI